MYRPARWEDISCLVSSETNLNLLTSWDLQGQMLCSQHGHWFTEEQMCAHCLQKMKLFCISWYARNECSTRCQQGGVSTTINGSAANFILLINIKLHNDMYCIRFHTCTNKHAMDTSLNGSNNSPETHEPHIFQVIYNWRYNPQWSIHSDIGACASKKEPGLYKVSG